MYSFAFMDSNSFLTDLGTQILPTGLSIVDDAFAKIIAKGMPMTVQHNSRI